VVVEFVLYDLGGEVLEGAKSTLTPFVCVLYEPEVYQFGVEVLIDEDVLI
jgi:hypothetical protein